MAVGFVAGHVEGCMQGCTGGCIVVCTKNWMWGDTGGCTRDLEVGPGPDICLAAAPGLASTHMWHLQPQALRR